MSSFFIQGGRPLQGKVTINPSKNGALFLLSASLLNKGTTILHNIPQIEEVKRILEVFASLEIEVERRGRTVIIRPPSRIPWRKINRATAERTRAIILLVGALSASYRKFLLPKPGGCRLGRRSLLPHIYSLSQLGVEIEVGRKELAVNSSRLRPGNIVLYEAGDTVTGNVLLAAAGIAGTTVIRFASANYQVQELCFFLEKLGVKIEGVGTTTLEVTGRGDIDKTVEYTLSEDPIEAMFFISLAATAKGNLLLQRCPIDFLYLELLKLEKMGLNYKIKKRYLADNGQTNLVDLEILPSQLVALNDKITAGPYPDLNIDNLPYFVPIATQAKGVTLIHDWVYENRAIYYTELNKLGADIMLADPHRVYIRGRTKFKAGEIVCPPALRPSTNILIAMLAARGKSILRNIYSIERGYENLPARLEAIGAEITKVE